MPRKLSLNVETDQNKCHRLAEARRGTNETPLCCRRIMEFQPLTQLRTKLNKDVPTAVVDKLNFLWRAATACLEREPVVVSSSSHRLCQSFVETASQHNVDIPKTVSDRLCGYCSVLLVPAVTCQVRVRERTRLSRVNRAKKDRLKNQVVSTSARNIVTFCLYQIVGINCDSV